MATFEIPPIIGKPEPVFHEEEHKYFDPFTGEELTSATTFNAQFFSKFDEDDVIDKHYDRWQDTNDERYAGLTKEQIKEKWEDNRVERAGHGTRVHDYIENCIKGNITKKDLDAIENDEDRLKAVLGYEIFEQHTAKIKPDITIAEKRIYSSKHKIAGTIDLLLYNKKTKTVVLMDWKTNNKLKFEGHNNKTAKDPVSHLQDCNFSKYNLQLSLYGYILETEYDVEIDKLKVVHLKEDSCTVYDVEYLRKSIQDMIEYVK